MTDMRATERLLAILGWAALAIVSGGLLWWLLTMPR